MSGIIHALSTSAVARLLLAVALVAAGIAVERAWFLGRRAPVRTETFLAEVRRLVGEGRTDRAMRVCQASLPSHLPRVVAAGLQRMEDGPETASLAARAAAADAAPELTRRVGGLAVAADVAILLGVLGVIEGLARAFRDSAGPSAGVRRDALSAAVADALATAGAGIGLAAALVVVHGLLAGRADRILGDLGRGVAVVAELASSRPSRTAGPPPPGPGGPP
ncbi:MotA/TolQ/ExbB proton channel family protein [Myxococcota bacterium]|nr:MotA/TolQ/ExbB proton channel family protein [Myxococcota bacterium]